MGQRRNTFTAGNKTTLKAISSTGYTPMFSVRPKKTFENKVNNQKIHIVTIGFSNSTTGFHFELLKNASLTNDNFQDVSSALSSMEVDLAATAFSGGESLFGSYGYFLTRCQSAAFLEAIKTGGMQDIYTIAARANSGSGTLGMVLNWSEEYPDFHY